MFPKPPTLENIQAAAAGLAGRIRRTPLVAAPSLSHRTGRDVHAKLENRQVAACFKPRGALTFSLRAADRGPVAGLVTASSGNHGQAVALAAATLGVPCAVVVPEDVRPLKQRRIEELGAEVVRHGFTSTDRLDLAAKLADGRRWLFVPPYDHPDIVAGQATVGLELVEEMPAETTACVVPVGGGGLAAGVGIVLAAMRPSVRLTVAEPADADDLRRSLAAGRRERVEVPSTSACDGLRNSCVGHLNWHVLASLRPSCVAVSEASVAEAEALLRADGLGPVEPSGAAAAAALLSAEIGEAGSPVVVLVSGGNASGPASGPGA